MSATVTLHIFSGRPDPAWELDDSQVQELTRLLKADHRQGLVKPPGVAGGLGYRGFSIDAVGERHLEAKTYVHAGIADVGRFAMSLLLGSPEIEQFLLDTAGGAIDDTLREHVSSHLGGEKALFGGAEFDLRREEFLVAPPYDPGKWNNDPNVQARNNCYNYANDKITNTFAQPGRGSGHMYSAMACANVTDASRHDGQVSIPNPNITPAEGHIVALVIWPGYDFHWYRRDSNDMWSHKPGQTQARNRDASNRPIESPETCDRGPYSDFCGYFNSIPSKTTIN